MEGRTATPPPRLLRQIFSRARHTHLAAAPAAFPGHPRIGCHARRLRTILFRGAHPRRRARHLGSARRARAARNSGAPQRLQNGHQGGQHPLQARNSGIAAHADRGSFRRRAGNQRMGLRPLRIDASSFSPADKGGAASFARGRAVHCEDGGQNQRLTMKLILASSSPRRAEVMRNAGFVFEVHPADVDETRLPHESAEDYVRRVAQAKAHTVAARARAAGERAIVIAADTTVVAEGQILAKPEDAADARRMLGLFNGKTHEVLTALCVINIPAAKESLHVEKTRVEFLKMSEEEIADYIQTGEPFDKAGAYGIQGIAGRFATRIEGCYFNVLGLPLSRLWTTLQALGWKEDGTN